MTRPNLSGQPAGSERAVPSAAASADGPVRGVGAQRPPVLHQRQHLIEQERRVPVVEGVVFGVAVLALVGVVHVSEDARVDEDADGGRQRPGADEVVQYDAGPHLTVGVEVPPTILEHD